MHDQSWIQKQLIHRLTVNCLFFFQILQDVSLLFFYARGLWADGHPTELVYAPLSPHVTVTASVTLRSLHQHGALS